MEVCKSDVSLLIRYLDEAARFYATHYTNLRECDRARLLKKFSNKLIKKQNNDKK